MPVNATEQQGEHPIARGEGVGAGAGSQEQPRRERVQFIGPRSQEGVPAEQREAAGPAAQRVQCDGIAGRDHTPRSPVLRPALPGSGDVSGFSGFFFVMFAKSDTLI